jgi:predicted lipoprotein with Yx(FWY)xxD motif
MFGRRYALALLAVIALTLGACTASTSGSSPAPAATAPTPIPSVAESPTSPAAESEEPTASASDVAGAGDYPLAASENAAVGPYLTGAGGMTVYTFKNDTKDSGKSVCNGDCATNWPPYALDDADEVTPGAGVTGTVSVITRDDGTKQVAYNGWPLYYFANDAAPGDTNGHEVGDVWFVAIP